MFSYIPTFVNCKQRLIVIENLTAKVLEKKLDYNHGFVREKTASTVIRNVNSFTIRPSDLRKCYCIVVYRLDSRIVKLLSFLITVDAVFLRTNP